MTRAAARPTRALQRLGVSPNQVTVAAMAIGLVAALLVARGHLRVGAAVWVVGRVLDGLDGLLARASGRTTLFGGFLDISLDMLAYSAMAIGFAQAMPADRPLWMLVLAGYVMAITTTLALSSLLERAGRSLGGNRSLQFTAGLAEGGETTFVYVAIALLPGWSDAILAAWIALLAATMLARGALAWRVLA